MSEETVQNIQAYATPFNVGVVAVLIDGQVFHVPLALAREFFHGLASALDSAQSFARNV